MSVKDIMHAITTVDPDASVTEICKMMRDKNIGSVLIRLDALRWGIVTERDILVKVVASERDPKFTKVVDIMTDLRYTIDSKSSIHKASEMFNKHPIRRLPVMENGEIVGMVTVRDVAKYWAFKSARAKHEYGRSSLVR